MDKENQLDKDLKAAAEKKDKAMATDPTLKDQFKIGIEFRKDQGLAVIKDKTKNIVKKGKNKFYGVVDLLKNKIDWGG